MTITKEEFEKYERVRFKFRIEYIEVKTGLNRNKILEIMKTYNTLLEKYPDVRNI